MLLDHCLLSARGGAAPNVGVFNLLFGDTLQLYRTYVQGCLAKAQAWPYAAEQVQSARIPRADAGRHRQYTTRTSSSRAVVSRASTAGIWPTKPGCCHW
jgi:hypothetical protein